MTKYFVILRHQNGKPLPLLDSDDDAGFPILYDEYDDAETAAMNNVLGENFGFEIFEWEM